MRVITPSTPLFNQPDVMSGRETDALFGEAVEVISHQDTHQTGWAEVNLSTDGYQAWAQTKDLGQAPLPTHHVIVPRSLITQNPDIKSPSKGYLPLGALVTASDEGELLALYNDQGILGYMPRHHALPLGQFVDDYVKIAEDLMNVPYCWGGRDTIGIDCSALVQLSLAAAGVKTPRNTGDQEKAIGTSLNNLDELQRGDLVFWKGHIGIMTDAETLLHANAHHHMVAAENLREAIPRLEDAAGPITRLARI